MTITEAEDKIKEIKKAGDAETEHILLDELYYAFVQNIKSTSDNGELVAIADAILMADDEMPTKHYA